MRAVCFLLLFLFFLAGCGTNNPIETPKNTGEQITSLPITFTTTDGYAISGTWFTSNLPPAKRPAVILLHMFEQNHIQWFPFVPDLATAGYHVLAFDLRGHGNSQNKNGEFSPFNRFSLEDVNDMPLDVEGAITWLNARPEVDTQRIGVIGADIGANIAFVSSGIFPEIKTTVSLSPIARAVQTVLIGEDLTNFHPHTILFLAAFGDGYTYTSSEDLAARTEAPHRVTGYQGTAKGVVLLNNAIARAEVLTWLKDNL
ncbi:MAG: alpha/beta fold hydrolase [bacterium]|nr:alpha/beta fold hydrolase [bacterium]